MEGPDSKIWSDYRLDVEQIGHWKIGPLKLWVRRFTNEWIVTSVLGQDPLDKSVLIEVPSNTEYCPFETDETNRYGVRATSDTITLRPSLADRPMVIRPEMPFVVPQGEAVDIWVSTSLWVNVLYREETKKLLTEIPVFRPSDTWFGPPTLEGELCYASRTSAKLRYGDLAKGAYRAVTKVHIVNSKEGPLHLERFKLPVLNLALYASSSGPYFTESVTVEREEGTGEVKVKFGPPPEKEGGKMTRIASPRLKPDRNIVFRALHSLIG